MKYLSYSKSCFFIRECIVYVNVKYIIWSSFLLEEGMEVKNQAAMGQTVLTYMVVKLAECLIHGS